MHFRGTSRGDQLLTIHRLRGRIRGHLERGDGAYKDEIMWFKIERFLIWPEKKTSATVDPEKEQIMPRTEGNTPASARPNGTPQRRLRAQQADQVKNGLSDLADR
jgi:hypothetical protein